MANEPEEKEITIRTALKACTRDHWSTALMWLWYTLFYWKLPSFIVIASLLVGQQKVKVSDLVIHGELLIYAITITAASTRLLAKDLRGKSAFVNRQGFNLISHVLIFPAICIYGIVRYIGATNNPHAVNESLVEWYSGGVLVLSFIFSFFMFLFDAQRTSPDALQKQIAASLTHAGDKLNEGFNQIQGPPPEEAEPISAVPQEPIDPTTRLGEGLDSVEEDK